MKSFLELAYERYSCRNFKPGSNIPRELLENIMKTAVAAPSSCNAQPWRYIVVDEAQRVAQLADAITDAKNSFCKNAAAFVVVMESKRELDREAFQSMKYIGTDIGISVAHILLAAQDAGVSSCVIASFNERKIKTLLGIPKTRRMRLVIALGISAEQSVPAKQRRPFDETVTFNKY